MGLEAGGTVTAEEVKALLGEEKWNVWRKGKLHPEQRTLEWVRVNDELRGLILESRKKAQVVTAPKPVEKIIQNDDDAADYLLDKDTPAGGIPIVGSPDDTLPKKGGKETDLNLHAIAKPQSARATGDSLTDSSAERRALFKAGGDKPPPKKPTSEAAGDLLHQFLTRKKRQP